MEARRIIREGKRAMNDFAMMILDEAVMFKFGDIDAKKNVIKRPPNKILHCCKSPQESSSCTHVGHKASSAN